MQKYVFYSKCRTYNSRRATVVYIKHRTAQICIYSLL